MRARPRLLSALSAATAVVAPLLSAAVVGTNAPVKPLTVERLAELPAAERTVWEAYIARSTQQHQADQAVFEAELKRTGRQESFTPPPRGVSRKLPLDQSAAWYREGAARRLADIVVSFQTPAGGWSKNLDFTHHRRAPGERFSLDSGWSYVGTFDNDATTTQLRYLAKVIVAVGTEGAAAHHAAFERGLEYLLAAQYPNGGWPQVWPLQGGYHDAITYNDGAMVHVLELLSDVAAGQADFGFVAGPLRARATASVQRGLECILATQIIANGRRTVWCQQHDPLTRRPTSARNYEMPSAAAAESATVLDFLMRQPAPNPATAAAIRAAAEWFQKTQIPGVAFSSSGSGAGGRRLVATPGAGPLWARFYDLATDRPIFGDRDRRIYDCVEDISAERRNGYSWYNDAPAKALKTYEQWARSHP